MQNQAQNKNNPDSQEFYNGFIFYFNLAYNGPQSNISINVDGNSVWRKEGHVEKVKNCSVSCIRNVFGLRN